MPQIAYILSIGLNATLINNYVFAGLQRGKVYASTGVAWSNMECCFWILVLMANNAYYLSLMVNLVIEPPGSIILTEPKGSSIIRFATASWLTHSDVS